MLSTVPRLRIAPSPTGDPHIGTAYMALFDYAFARQNGGDFVLRIEDTDRARYSETSEQGIFNALHWLGLNWDEGPDIGGPYEPYRQSERLPIYAEYAHKLVEDGHAYYCFCTRERLEEMRKAQAAAKQPPKYDRLCLRLDPATVQSNLESGVPRVIRLKMPDTGMTTFTDLVRGPVSFQNDLQDDPVLLKADGFPTYHLAVVVDDYLMRITHIVRGEEWISSTPKHVVLYHAFGWEPPYFIHMPLMRNADKSKISKRKNNTSLNWYREQGFLPAALLNYLALQGWSMPDGRETFSLEEFIAAFTWDRVVAGEPIFDIKRLDDLNGQYIRMLSVDELVDALRPFTPDGADPAMVRAVVPLVQTRINRLSEFPVMAGYFFHEPEYETVTLVEKNLGPDGSRALLQQVYELCTHIDDWTHTTLEQNFRALAESAGVKMRQLAEVARVPITGSKAGPPLFESMELLGRETCLMRIARALERK
ncbi:MAG: glutamate--tRNA ligase [Chloroflexi bacterium]|nr:glutamate--tRNA ligase [Chloroflexota bacterium]